MKKLGRLMIIPVLFLVFSSLIPGNITQASTIFDDIQSDFWAKDEIHYLHSLGIISGYEENGSTLYKWNNSVTRAQAAKMIVMAKGQTELKVTSPTFDDVQPNHWASGWVERAARLGVFTGNDSGNFNPNGYLTRAQMSKILSVAFDLDDVAAAQEPVVFTDASSGHWAFSFINALYYNGISSANNGLYRPNQDVDRAQFAAFMSRSLSEDFKLAVQEPSPAPTQDTYIARLEVKEDSLNVRSGAGTSYSVLGKLNTGHRLFVYGVSGDWAKVDYNGKMAYVHKAYVTFLDYAGHPLGAPTANGTVNTNGLNVRSQPSSTSQITGKLNNGNKVVIYGTQGDWLKIEHNSLPQFVHKAYVTIDVPTPTPTSALTGKVTADSLNVRSGAGTAHPIVTTVKLNDRVTVESINGFWAKIKANGTTGYVNKTYLKLLNNSGSILKDRIIVIDPGHGATDPGATVNGYTEKAINMEVGRRVEAKLKAAGANVKMTRTGDTFPSLQDRVDFAYRNYGEIFVSIHANAIGNSTVSGAETFYDVQYNDNAVESSYLAREVQREIVTRAGMRDRGIKSEAFYVLRNQNIPAILVELGFMTNPSDLAKLTSSAYMEIYATAIYDGIVDYYNLK
ncbi:N-acetylmuramoyl-L-alanine amidase [Jeotgalibacillus aurantiacus]|uniref:N-acetylmuramoyl-L-alanine amidase n=1 Tax=Jeotgalibacillus aurantiacus TaxID=2763266 RepID=UPI001D0A0E44|nr:N-acetylmuramoyl-L-alanine amidase [Jeotgalibacillus aurantiacus]